MNDTPASKTLPAFAGQGRRTSMRQPLGQYEFPGSLGYQLFDRLEAEKPRHLLHQVFDTNIKWRRYDSSLGDQPTNQLQETPTKPPYWSLSLQCCTSSAPCNFCPKVERTWYPSKPGRFKQISSWFGLAATGAGPILLTDINSLPSASPRILYLALQLILRLPKNKLFASGWASWDCVTYLMACI